MPAKTAKAAARPAQRSSKGAEGLHSGPSASALIDQRIRELGGWRGETLARMRGLLLAADKGIVEEWKWSVPVWSKDGILCTGEHYKSTVKLTFAQGAALPDPGKLFNAGFGGGTRRAIDLGEGATVDAARFKALVRAAEAFNAAKKKG